MEQGHFTGKPQTLGRLESPTSRVFPIFWKFSGSAAAPMEGSNAGIIMHVMQGKGWWRATAVGLRRECPAASAIVLANVHIKRESRAE